MRTVVDGLPKSWASTANIKMRRLTGSLWRHSGRRASASRHSLVWVITSPSGCHAGSCGTPAIAATSGKWASQPVCSRTAMPFDGATDLTAHLSHSPQILSTGSSSNEPAMLRQSSADSGALCHCLSQGMSSNNPASAKAGTRPTANCMARRTRNGSSTNAALVCRRTFVCKSARPLYGSMIIPVSGS